MSITSEEDERFTFSFTLRIDGKPTFAITKEKAEHHFSNVLAEILYAQQCFVTRFDNDISFLAAFW